MTKENKPRNIQEEQLVQEARIIAKSLMDGVPEPLLLLDAQLRIKMVNHAFLSAFHLTEEEIENRFITEIMERKAWNVPRLPGLLEGVLLKNVSIKDVEIQGEFPGLGSRILQTSARTIFGEGKRQRILLVLKDITEQKRAEDVLHESEERFRAVAQSAVDAIISTDFHGDIVFWNQGAEEIFGYSEAEVLGQPLTMLMPERFVSRHEMGLKRLQTTGRGRLIGRTVELAGLKKDGTEFPIELSLSTWKAGDETFFTGIIRDISERKELDQVKDEFIATASHELRAPLSIIKIAISNLKDGIMGALSEKQEQAVEIAHYNVERLSQLIDELLNLSRLESGIAQVNYVPFNMMTLIRQAIENFKTQAGTKHLILTEDTATVLPTIEADPDMCQQVLTNLLDNAVRFAKKQIIVRAKVVGSFLQMSIVDDGPGITPQEQKELFTKFTQFHRSREGTSYKGSGLGLIICKRIVELHHGKIWVESFLGQGSVFQFMLPIKREMTLNQEGSREEERKSDIPARKKSA